MELTTISHRGAPKWLDSLAVGMSILCAIHCLITPVLVAVLPILATTIWTDQHFHLWMLLLVVPTTAFSLALGCRKHNDRWVVFFGSLGLASMVGVALYETFSHAGAALAESSACSQCSSCGSEGGGISVGRATAINLMGAGFLTTAHVRNFLLCRRNRCGDGCR